MELVRELAEAQRLLRTTRIDGLLGNSKVMERVDEEGHVLGFSVLGVSKFPKDHPLEAELVAGK